MSAAANPPLSARNGHAGYVIAWGFCLLFCFGQYAIRSAPGVMVPEPAKAFEFTTLGVSSLIGLLSGQHKWMKEREIALVAKLRGMMSWQRSRARSVYTLAEYLRMLEHDVAL